MQHPTWNESIWGLLLVIGLGTVALMTCAAVTITWTAVRRGTAEPFAEQQAIHEAGSLGEALTVLWTLVRLIFAWFSQRLPWVRRPLRGIEALGNQLFEWMMNWPWIGPRSHPWRFCAAVALVAGVALAAAHGLEEGPPINLALAVGASSIFIGVEFLAVLIGYLILGGFLGLRPPLNFIAAE